MAKPVASFTTLVACLSLLVLLAACSGRKLSASAQDQGLVPGTPKQAKVEPPPPKEVARAPEPPPPKEEAVAPEPAPPPAPAAPGPEPLVLSDVYFDYDQFVLRSDAKTALEGNARRLKAENGVVLIEGHCDERGTVAYNLVLGERRARMVEQYLKDLGVASSRLQITSYGKERPFCSVHSDHCWQQNRRAHFVLQ
jgi:peptidoglycan-associated lipoprotein